MDCKVTGEHVMLMFIDSGVFTHHSRFTSTAHSITHNPHHLTFGLSDPNKAITHINCPMAISWYMEEQHEIRIQSKLGSTCRPMWCPLALRAHYTTAPI